jgi:hypothetical protein
MHIDEDYYESMIAISPREKGGKGVDVGGGGAFPFSRDGGAHFHSVGTGAGGKCGGGVEGVVEYSTRVDVIGFGCSRTGRLCQSRNDNRTNKCISHSTEFIPYLIIH